MIPQYFSIERYPADKCIPFYKANRKWGIFSNFGNTPINVAGIFFSCVEKLFQCLKFDDPEVIMEIYKSTGQSIKMKSKHWVKEGKERPDWGKYVVNAMKFCLNLKYDQIPEFRKTLEESKGFYIVEDQTTFSSKNADNWGVKHRCEEYVGSNLMGRLLMELRDNGKFNVDLPEAWLSDLSFLK